MTTVHLGEILFYSVPKFLKADTEILMLELTVPAVERENQLISTGYDEIQFLEFLAWNKNSASQK